MAQRIDDRWQIEKQIGEGGQAHTFLVIDVGTGDRAVLKRLKNPNRLPRFEQEIAAIRLLDNPHILRLLDAKTNDTKPYLVSEYCELGSLEDQRDAIQQLSIDERLEIAAQIADALAAIHQAGVIHHRDLKPSNIFLRTLRDAVVGDFGVCFTQPAERLTETMEAVGARYYIAPELAEGRSEEVTPRADIYSFGKVIYWLFAGRVFDREDHRRDDRLLTKYFADDAILHVHQLLDVMIAYDKNERLPDGSVMPKNVAELRRLLRGGYPDVGTSAATVQILRRGNLQDARQQPRQVCSIQLRTRSDQQSSAHFCVPQLRARRNVPPCLFIQPELAWIRAGVTAG